MWNILTIWVYGLYDFSKRENKVSDSSHRIVTVNILVLSPDHDAGRIHHNCTSIDREYSCIKLPFSSDMPDWGNTAVALVHNADGCMDFHCPRAAKGHENGRINIKCCPASISNTHSSFPVPEICTFFGFVSALAMIHCLLYSLHPLMRGLIKTQYSTCDTNSRLAASMMRNMLHNLLKYNRCILCLECREKLNFPKFFPARLETQKIKNNSWLFFFFLLHLKQHWDPVINRHFWCVTAQTNVV